MAEQAIDLLFVLCFVERRMEIIIAKNRFGTIFLMRQKG